MSFQARRAGVRTPFCRQVEAKSPQSSYNGGALEGWKLFWPPVHRIPNPIDGSMSNWIHAHVGGVQRPCFWRVAFAPQRDTKRTSPHTHTHTLAHAKRPSSTSGSSGTHGAARCVASGLTSGDEAPGWCWSLARNLDEGTGEFVRIFARLICDLVLGRCLQLPGFDRGSHVPMSKHPLTWVQWR